MRGLTLTRVGCFTCSGFWGIGSVCTASCGPVDGSGHRRQLQGAADATCASQHSIVLGSFQHPMTLTQYSDSMSKGFHENPRRLHSCAFWRPSFCCATSVTNALYCRYVCSQGGNWLSTTLLSCGSGAPSPPASPVSERQLSQPFRVSFKLPRYHIITGLLSISPDSLIRRWPFSTRPSGASWRARPR